MASCSDAPGRPLGRRACAAALVVAMSLTLVTALPSGASATTLFSDGFESGNTSAWTKTVPVTMQPETGYFRSGTYGLEAISTGAGKTFVSKTLVPSQPELYARVWFDVISQGSKVTLLRFRPGLSSLVAVAVTTKGALNLTDSFTGISYSSPNGLVTPGGWHLLQVHVNVTVGRVDVWLDGLQISKLSRSVSLGTTPVSKMEVGESAGARTYDVAFDDVAIDTAYIGPTVPTGLQGSAPSSTEADLTWDPPSSTDPSVTYTVYRSADSADLSPPVVGTSTGQTFVDRAVAASSTYFYWVDAVDPTGQHSPRTDPPVQVVTLDPSGTPPGQPQGLAAAAPASRRVDLTWLPNPPSDGVENYIIDRAPDAVSVPEQLGIVTDTSFSDSTAEPGTSYFYSIRAQNTGGASPDSAQVSVTTPSDTDPMIAAAGDIACDPADPKVAGTDSKHCQQQATANLLGQGPAGGYAAILPLGDAQYDCGGLSAFQQVYANSWGQSPYMGNTMPVPGNHEYNNSASSSGTGCPATHNGSGFYSYFSQFTYFTSPTVYGSPSTGYYSYDIGGWHIIALNAECGYIHGCLAGSTEETWLAADLAAHPSQCTMAYWHQPRWADGSHTSDPSYDAFWRDLYAAGAELVLNGHEHMYERFAPQTPDGVSDPVTGITQITAGTGGEGHAKAGVPLPLSLVSNSDTFGVLQVTLHPDSYEWHFAPAAVPGGGTFNESGATMCHGAS